jgi:hypothetical protein
MFLMEMPQQEKIIPEISLFQTELPFLLLASGKFLSMK